MADIRSLPGAAPPPASQPARPLRAVRGWCREYFDDDQPPVIVNPAAPMHLLADWAHGQLKQANIVLSIFGTWTTEEASLENAAGAVRHFTEQAESVLLALLDRLEEDWRASEQR